MTWNARELKSFTCSLKAGRSAALSVFNNLKKQFARKHRFDSLGQFSCLVKLTRATNSNFGWVVLVALMDIAFLLVFFLLLSSNFILQQGVSVSMPFSRFTLGPETSRQIISITGGAVPAIYFQDQRVTIEQLGPLLDAAKLR